MTRYVRGTDLSPANQAEALRAYVHRHTGDHRPNWVPRDLKLDGKPRPLPFASDEDWLAHTHFPVRKDGRLSSRPSACVSEPTWPNGRPDWKREV